MNLIYNFYPNRLLASISGINIYWYGLFLFFAVIVGLMVFLQLSKKEKIDKNISYDLFFYSMIFGVIGARLFYVLYFLEDYLKNPIEILKIWNGGMSILGGVCFGFLGLFFLCKIKKIGFKKILNISVIVLVSAQIIGRIGNYFNQELFGIPTSFFLKIPIEKMNRPLEYINAEFFTPLFFYEIFFNLILLGILLFLFNKKNKNNLEIGIVSKELKLKDFRKNMKLLVSIENGFIFYFYLNYYLILRFVLEFFRVSEPKMFYFTYNQIVCILVLLIVDSYLLLKKK